MGSIGDVFADWVVRSGPGSPEDATLQAVMRSPALVLVPRKERRRSGGREAGPGSVSHAASFSFLFSQALPGEVRAQGRLDRLAGSSLALLQVEEIRKPEHNRKGLSDYILLLGYLA